MINYTINPKMILLERNFSESWTSLEKGRGLGCKGLTLTFCERPRQNFSLQYQYNIKQTNDENKEKYQLGDYLVDPIPNSPN